MNWQDLPLRTQHLLEHLLVQFIRDGLPVASKSLAQSLDLNISSATIRNIMADLEAQGLLASKYTSSGKVPTAKAYKLIAQAIANNGLLGQIDNQNQLSLKQILATVLKEGNLETQKQLTPILQHIAQCTHTTVLLSLPYQKSLLQQVEFIKIDDYKLLLILITPTGSVQNHLLQTQQNYTPEQLKQAANFINEHYHGMYLDEIYHRLVLDVSELQQSILELTQKALAVHAKPKDQLIIAGESQLLQGDLTESMRTLRQLFDLFEEKNVWLELLQASQHAKGVQIFMGEELQTIAQLNQINLENTSLVASHMHLTDTVASLAVIGPMRMNYHQIIPLLQLTSSMLTDYLQEGL